MDYDRTDIHLRYDAARQLPDETLRLWLDRVASHMPPGAVHTIVDLGCGTGRFSGALAAHFGARVLGIEPSQKMLDTARAALAGRPVALCRGYAEDLPLGDHVADLVFLSMVYHHLRDKTMACREFRRVLKQGGGLCIRTSTVELLDSYLWMPFFPAAREIERERLPSAAALIATLEGQGFRLAAQEVVQQRFAQNLHEYVEKIALRGISSLQAIPDDAFAQSLAHLRAYCAAQRQDQPIDEAIGLFVFSSARVVGS